MLSWYNVLNVVSQQRRSTLTHHMWIHLKDVKISASVPEQKEKQSEKSEICLPFSHDKKAYIFIPFLIDIIIDIQVYWVQFLSKETNILFAHMLQHQKKSLDAVEPNANQSLLDIGAAAIVSAVTTPPTSTMEYLPYCP